MADSLHAHPGRHHRGRAGRPAAVPPARPPGGRRGRRREPLPRRTSRRACGPACSSRAPSTCWSGPGWATGCCARACGTTASTCSGRASGHRIDFPALTGRSVGSTGRPRSSRTWWPRGSPPALPLHFEVSDTAVARPGDRPAPAVVHDAEGAAAGPRVRRRRRLPTASTASAGRPSRSSCATLVARLPVRLARHPGRGAALHRRADLRAAPARLRDAQHALAEVSRLYLQVDPAERLEDWPDDRVWEELATRLALPGWQLQTGRSSTRASPRCAASSASRCGTGAVPRRRRGAHRAADRREGPQPGGRRRRACSPARSRRCCCAATPPWPTPTGRPRCAGSGARRSSRPG